MSGKKGIVELSEFLVAAGALMQIGKKLSEGGINKDDIAVLFTELMVKYPVILKGFDGMSEAVLEAKDLDGTEIVQLVSVVVEEIKKVEAV